MGIKRFLSVGLSLPDHFCLHITVGIVSPPHTLYIILFLSFSGFYLITRQNSPPLTCCLQNQSESFAQPSPSSITVVLLGEAGDKCTKTHAWDAYHKGWEVWPIWERSPVIWVSFYFSTIESYNTEENCPTTSSSYVYYLSDSF